jgi:hypothetical protein
MRIRATVVTRRAVAVRQLHRQPATNQGFERLVNRGQRNVGDLRTHAGEHIIGGRVRLRTHEVSVDRRALLGESLPVRLQRLAQQILRLHRVHRATNPAVHEKTSAAVRRSADRLTLPAGPAPVNLNSP